MRPATTLVLPTLPVWPQITRIDMGELSALRNASGDLGGWLAGDRFLRVEARMQHPVARGFVLRRPHGSDGSLCAELRSAWTAGAAVSPRKLGFSTKLALSLLGRAGNTFSGWWSYCRVWGPSLRSG